MNLSAWIHITDRCNLRCSYCFLRHRKDDLAPEIGQEIIDAVFRSARLHKIREVKLKYAGGEPLIRAGTIWKLHQYARKQAPDGLAVRGIVLSNGTLLTPEIITQLKELDLELMISLDGLGEIHDRQRPLAGGGSTSAQAQAAIDLAIRYDFWPVISVTVTGQNASSLADLVAWLVDPQRRSQDNPKKALKFSLNFYRENDCVGQPLNLQLKDEAIIQGVLAAYQVLEENLPGYSLLGGLADRANFITAHDRPCGVGENYLVFDTRGQVSKCQMVMDQVVTTAADPDPLKTIQQEKSGLQNPPITEKHECAACQWKSWCGSCPYAAFRATGNYAAKSENCQIYQAIYPQLVRLEGLRLLKEKGIAIPVQAIA